MARKTLIAAGLRCTPHQVFYTIIKLKEDDLFSLDNQELNLKVKS